MLPHCGLMIPEKEEEVAETMGHGASFVSRHFLFIYFFLLFIIIQASALRLSWADNLSHPLPVYLCGHPLLLLLSRLLRFLLASPGNGEFVKRWQWIKVVWRQATCQAEVGVFAFGKERGRSVGGNGRRMEICRGAGVERPCKDRQLGKS